MAFIDNFTGTTGTKLNTRTGWAQIGYGSGSQIPEINGSNQLRAAAAADDVPLVGQDAGHANHYVQANVYAGFQFASGAAYPQLMVRATTRGDSFGVGYNIGAGAWHLISNNNSVAVSFTRAFVSGDLVRLEAEGPSVRVLVNGTKIIDYTATDRLTNTYVGIVAAGTAGSDPVLDNYESGQLAAAAPPSTAAFSTRTIDGQNVTYTFTTTNAPNVGDMSLSATSSGTTQGPNLLTFGSGTASITFMAVPPGTYTESGTVSGAGGGGAITGLGTLTIAGIDGAPIDTGEPPAPVVTVDSVTVSPSTATGSTTFSATVTGQNSPSQAVTWSLSPNVGSITADGVFTAPAATTATQTITVKAASTVDATKYGAATVTIAALPNVVPPPFSASGKGRARRKGRR